MKRKERLNWVFRFRESEDGKSAEELVKELVDDTIKKVIAKHKRSAYT